MTALDEELADMHPAQRLAFHLLLPHCVAGGLRHRAAIEDYVDATLGRRG